MLFIIYFVYLQLCRPTKESFTAHTLPSLFFLSLHAKQVLAHGYMSLLMVVSQSCFVSVCACKKRKKILFHVGEEEGSAESCVFKGREDTVLRDWLREGGFKP